MAEEIHKIVREAVHALDELKQALASSSGYDIDYLPKGTVSKALEALSTLDRALTEERKPATEIKVQVLKAMDEIKLDDAATQTMLGSQQAEEFLKIYRTIQTRLGHKDPKKVASTLFGRLEK
jgi:hypothetical protein